MADDSDGEKSEEPTGKRLTDAKGKGQVAQSQEFQSWAILLTITLLIGSVIPSIMAHVAKVNRNFIEKAHAFSVSPEDFQNLFKEVILDIGIVILPLMLTFLAVGVAMQILQVGWTVSAEKFQISLSKFSPHKGIKKFFGVRPLVEAFKGIVKLGIVGTVVFFLVAPMLNDVELLPAFDLLHTLDRVKKIALVMLVVTVMIMTVIAAIDFAYQKWDHTEKLKMTKQEVKDERKQQDGDPKIKQRMAALRMERQRERMMQAIGKADVIITNPTHYAIALKYDMDTMPAPVLVGKGVDDLARRIREVAEENDIPIVENPPLARALYAGVEIDEEIPAEHFHAVAEVIGYVFRLKGKMAQMDQAAADQAAKQAADQAGDAQNQENEDKAGPILN
ncbi:MAG: flagellar biosynthesis protein FlhB [Rhodospirillaceae bacterium]|nr:flagellar biosynthesis protein FlhB [Rhodospirillaceae bacterium]